jgi:hypothetical protein
MIWERAGSMRDEIIADLRENFDIIRVYEIRWSSRHFSRNMSRFYGQKLPPGSHKERHCGTGPFTLCIVLDPNPEYGVRRTLKGDKKVNVRTFDAKEKYRDWTGGGHRIHGTNSPEETSHDLWLLLGLSPTRFIAENDTPWDGTIPVLSRDLVGADGWDSIGSLLSILNETSIYVVLRNFEALPDYYYADQHGDIDLLTDDSEEVHFISNARRMFWQPYRVHYAVTIAGRDVFFDFRRVGDGYFDQKWEKKVLEGRTYSERGFFTPDRENYFYTLLYHVVVHKKDISSDYQVRLSEMALSLGLSSFSAEIFRHPDELYIVLNRYLEKHGYGYVEPRDLSVLYHPPPGVVPISFLRRTRELVRRTLLPVVLMMKGSERGI